MLGSEDWGMENLGEDADIFLDDIDDDPLDSLS
jgi:hypothetical protein